MHPAGDLEELMARYQGGDLAAATSLIHRLSPQLHRFFLARYASRHEADDLLQETWLRIHEARRTYRPGEPVLPWLYAIARHTAVDHFRRASRLAMREVSAEDLDRVAPPEDSTRTPDLETLLAPLPESQREVVAMLKVSGMSLEEVARATSSSVGSVKQKAHRAYEKLRDVLKGTGVERRRAGGLP